MTQSIEEKNLITYLKNSKKWIYKIWVDKNDDPIDFYMDAQQFMVFMKKETKHSKILLNCYPIDFTTNYKDLVDHHFDVLDSFDLYSIQLAVDYFGKDQSIITVPKKNSPLLITSETSEFIFGLVPMGKLPMFEKKERDFNSLYNHIEFNPSRKLFVKFTGCICPDFLDSKFQSE